MALITQLDAKIWLALKARLDTLPGGYDIIDAHENYPTDTSKPFILVQDVRFDPVPRYVNPSSSDEHRGQLAIAIMTPLDSWTYAQQIGLAGAIRAHMPKGAQYTNADCVVRILETPSIGTAYRDGPFNRLPVFIRWRTAG
jgi:hypothetical protein